MIQPVESLEITVLVDKTDNLSINPGFLKPRWPSGSSPSTWRTVRLHGLFARRSDQCYHARGESVSGHPPLWRLGRLPPGWPERGDHLETVDALEAFDLQRIAAAHCTGWRALGQLAQRFGDRVVPSAVGKRFVL
jgi:hypothetical protein